MGFDQWEADRDALENERRLLGCICPVWLVNGGSINPRLEVDDRDDCPHCHPVYARDAADFVQKLYDSGSLPQRFSEIPNAVSLTSDSDVLFSDDSQLTMLHGRYHLLP